MSVYDNLKYIFPIAIKLPEKSRIEVMGFLNVITYKFPTGSSFAWTADKEILYMSAATAQRITNSKTLSQDIKDAVMHSVNTLEEREDEIW